MNQASSLANHAAAAAPDAAHDVGELPAVIVVGAGPVGIRCVEELAQLAPERAVKLFSGEPFKPYDRVKLSLLLAHDIREQDIYSPILGGKHLQVYDDCAIVAIDREGKRVQDRSGDWHRYSKLVLALGSTAFVPNLAHTNSQNVFTFRDLKDTHALAARNMGSRHTVVVGGGLLGLETARAMQRNHTAVTVVQMAGHLMNQQLDAGAGAMLEAAVRKLGIEVVCNARASELLVDPKDAAARVKRVNGVRLDTGTVLHCDTVIIAAGIRPRTHLALQHGLNVGRGIRVNAHMQTSDPDIYAIGECIQFGEQLYGLVAPGWEHAAIAAHHMLGQPAEYKGSIAATSLKVVGKNVFSVGSVNQELEPALTTEVFQDQAQDVYRAVFTIRGRLAGALAIGGWPEQQRIRASITEGRRITFWQLLRFRRKGLLWPEAAEDNIRVWPAGMVVCNCTGVTRGQLSAACTAGACSVEQLATATRASTVCGSCKPLLATLVGTLSAPAPAVSTRWLYGLSVLALVTLAALLLIAPLPYATTVQVRALDWLWRDNLAKQISGYTLLGLASLSLLLSLSKRLRWFRLGAFTSWRLFHSTLGALAIGVLLLHTGMQLGANLNRWLMLDLLLLLLAGVLTGVVIGREHLWSPRRGRQARSWLTWSHTLLFWPLPLLLGFHVLSVYWF